MTNKEFRSNFNYFKNNKSIYLDSAATTQKPKQVIDSISMYLNNCANPGRTPFGRSNEINLEIEDSRNKIASYFNTQSNNLAFTSGVTDGMNILSQSLLSYIIDSEAEILVCESDHKSTILPWIELSKKHKNIKIKYYNLQPFTGLIDEKDLIDKITPKTKIIVLTHAHNVFGIVNDVNSITSKIPSSIITILDSAQTASHIKVDFKTLGIDFLLFSGHKMFALEKTGGILSTQRGQGILTKIHHGGGNEESTYPHILEVGTQNTSGIISMKTAIEIIETYGISNLHENVKELTKYCIDKLSSIPKIKFTPGPAYNNHSNNTGIISFEIEADLFEIGTLIDSQNINIRLGKHCSSDINFKDTLRISIHAYNNKEDIDKIVNILQEI